MGQLKIYNFVRALSYPYQVLSHLIKVKKIIINNCETSKLIIPGIKIGEVRKYEIIIMLRRKEVLLK